MPIAAATPTFYEAVDHLIQAEGGFVNDPKDSGGATKYGITLKTLQDFRLDATLGAKDVELLNLETAHEIYFRKYYAPLGLTQCTNRLACILILDQGANRGVGAVKRDIAEIFGFKLSPSYPTPIAILNFYQEQQITIPMLNASFAIEFLVRSQEAYESIIKGNPIMAKYLNGWLNRTHRLFSLIKT